MKFSRSVLVPLAVLGLVSANPAFAADATRSADTLPSVKSGAVANVPERANAACAPLEGQIAEAARFLRCARQAGAPAGGDYAGFLGSSGGFPLAIMVAVVVAVGAIALASGGSNDSPG